VKHNQSIQTKLSDFDDEDIDSSGLKQASIETPSNPQVDRIPVRPDAHLWRKTIQAGESWGVCEFDDTVLFSQIVDERLHIHGMEAFCKYCGGILEIRETKVFCSGECGIYQGRFSYDLDAYLHWKGAKSLTLRKEIAKEEGLNLEERDLESRIYGPEWSALDQYEEDEEESEHEEKKME